MIHAFTGGNDGSGPGARLTIDGQGNLYGMAPTGGANGLGTIYQIHPDGNNWTLNVIHTFTGGADGATGSAGQMLLRGGLLYGAATAGGNYAKGTVFELKPTQSGEWTSELFILSEVSRTQAFLMAACFLTLRGTFLGPHTMMAPIILVPLPAFSTAGWRVERTGAI